MTSAFLLVLLIEGQQFSRSKRGEVKGSKMAKHWALTGEKAAASIE
jgi:hypothetical protein